MTASAPSNKQNEHKNQRRKPKQARALQKYNAVLDACTQVLGQQGYPKTTMLELSLESGVAVPTIYQYFENKEAILLESLEDKTLTMLLTRFPAFARQLGEAEAAETKLRVLIKLVCGFLMFSLLKGEDNAQLQIQGRELEDLILLYLQQHGVA